MKMSKKKKVSKYGVMNVPLFDKDVLVVWGHQEHINDILNKYTVDKRHEYISCKGFVETFEEKGTEYIRMFLQDDVNIGVIAHECSHVADAICTIQGIKKSNHCEVRTKILEWCVNYINDKKDRNIFNPTKKDPK